MAMAASAEALARMLQIDTDAAAALLAAADGDPETAVAIHVGYNGGALPDGVDLGALTMAEGEKRARADDPEALRAAAADAAGGIAIQGAGVDMLELGTEGATGSLWLGSLLAAENAEWLKATQVTKVVTVMADPPAAVDGVERMHVAVRDDNVARLGPHLTPTCRQIDEWLRSGASVLVHCSSGVSRSPTVAIAFFIAHRGLSLRDAFTRVLSARHCVCPGTTFFSDLQQFELEVTGAKEPSMDLAQLYAHKVAEIAGIPPGQGPLYDQCVDAVRTYGWENDMAILAAAQAVAR
jgi:hypothetical protein